MARQDEKSIGGLSWTFVAVTINTSSFLQDFKKYLLPNCKPEWVGKPLKTKIFEDGLTNKLFGVYIDDHFDQMVLVRINGNRTDMFIVRDFEISSIVSLNKEGLSPPVYCEFNNGLCRGYEPGRMMALDDIADVSIAKHVAKCFARLHNTSIPKCFPQSNRLMEFFDWIDLMKEDFRSVEDKTRFSEIFGSLETLKKEVTEMKTIINDIRSQSVFSHNDAQPHNIIYNEATEKVFLIDFEYAGPNIRGFDIGNHFSEFAGLDISDMDFKQYPDVYFQKEWIKTYLEETALLKGRQSDSVTDEDIHTLYKEVAKCSLASHLIWAVWCILQSQYSFIDYNYIELAALRYNEYLARKQSFLTIK